jgi:YcaO-like protein with predicted kinase domain
VTVERVKRLAPVMGITRVANVTGLDQIGIPVVMVSRPNSRSVAVSQGKGIDLLSACASGLMEAAELYHAETITLPLRLATYEELRYQHKTVEPQKLARDPGSRFHSHLRLPWCEGRNLLNNEIVLVPYELVHTNYTVPAPDGHGCFSATSNGLASGNHILEAISHGICEVVERNATALWKLRDEEGLRRGRLDLESVDDPISQELLAKFERAGVAVAVWDITSDIELAAFACLIVPREDTGLWHCSVAAGFGCHPARQIALVRALTEAAQSRLTIISGLRDDFGRDVYEECQDSELLGAVRGRALDRSMTRRFQEVPNWDSESFEDDIAWELKCLRKSGLEQVIVIDLTKEEFGLTVVRVVIPDLQSMLRAGYPSRPMGEA